MPPSPKRWRPPRRQGLCSQPAHLWPTSDSAPLFGGPRRRQGSSSHLAHLWATCGRGYVATLPTFGPPMILPPALKRWGPPRPQGLCSHRAHLWATSDSAPGSEAVGTPQAAGGYVATLPTCGPPLILPLALKRRNPPGGRGYVATFPIRGPHLLLPPALKRCGPQSGFM